MSIVTPHTRKILLLFIYKMDILFSHISPPPNSTFFRDLGHLKCEIYSFSELNCITLQSSFSN